MPVIIGLCVVAFAAFFLALYPAATLVGIVAAVSAIWRLLATRSSTS